MEAMTVRRQANAGLAQLTIVGGALLVIQAIASAFIDQSTNYSATTGDLLSDGLLGAGLLVTLAGLDSLRRTLAPRFGWFALAGQAAITLAIVATIAAAHEVLDGVYIAGTAAWLVGTVAMAVVAARTRGVDKLVVILPVACVLSLALADTGGALLLGALWIVVGSRLRVDRAGDGLQGP